MVTKLTSLRDRHIHRLRLEFQQKMSTALRQSVSQEIVKGIKTKVNLVTLKNVLRC